MAFVCILGPSQCALPVVDAVSAEHEIHLVSPGSAAGTHGRCIAHRDFEDISGPIDVVFDTGYFLDRQNIAPALLSKRAVVVVNGLHWTATAAASALDVEVVRRSTILSHSYIPALFRRSTHMEVSIAAQQTEVSNAIELLRSIFPAREPVLVEDRIAHVSVRILAMIINEAAIAVSEGVARPDDIDIAMNLGANYPVGPCRWADEIEHNYICDVLYALKVEYGDDRYQISPSLKRMRDAGTGFFADPIHGRSQ